MLHKLVSLIYTKLIYPIKEAYSPRKDIALGAAIGMFWALNPLVGMQMYLTTFHWVIFRFFKIHFHLPIALAMVWITNPITMPFFYYTFYVSGFYFLKLFNLHFSILSFDSFRLVMERTSTLGLIDGMLYWIEFLFNEFGIPAFVGGFLWAIPLSLLTYPVTYYYLTKHRTKLAQKEGLTLKQWEEKHIHSFIEIVKQKNN